MKKIIILAAVLLFAAFTHGVNMTHYPYYENDEGTYFAQAYAVAYEGKMANYTYWYDHAPFGWIVTAGWMKATGGPFAFGFSLVSARIFMFFTHIFASLLLFMIVKKLSGKDYAAALSVILFSASPLAIYFQRRLLLDNIMTTFLLLSLFLILYANKRLLWIIASGIALVMSILSKETAAIFVPGFLFILFKDLHPKQRLIGFASFLMPIFLGLSFYILYAVLKNELFPGPGHVSLLGSIAYQATRDSVPFWSPSSDFMGSFKDWLGKDSIFIFGAVLATFFVTLFPKLSWNIRGIGILTLLIWAFFMRGSLVLNFYVTPLIALSCINISLMLQALVEYKKKIGLIIVLLILLTWGVFMTKKQWYVDETTPQVVSINWIKNNLPANSIMAIDNSQLLDLQLSRFPGDKAFPNAHWFWKLDKDPAIRNGVIKGDWENINYLVLTHEFLIRAKDESVPLVASALNFATQLVTWGPVSKDTYLNVPRRISTNGDWVQIYKVMDNADIALQQSWYAYKKSFITYEGQVIDPQANQTTSEGQSYGLIRSLVASDKDEFDLIWNWEHSHLEWRQSDKLFSWKWSPAKGGHITDSGFATDADIDTATALILAKRKWNDESYQNAAIPIIDDIWNQAVTKLGDGRYYLLPGSWASQNGTIIVNPSYISPAAFKLFAQVDPLHPWQKLYEDSYNLLNRIAASSPTELIPDWVGINSFTGGIFTPQDKNLSGNFGYDAMRAYFRIAQDYYWFNSKEAKAFLTHSTFLINYFKENQKIPAGFDMAGNPTVNYESNAFYGALLPYYYIVDKQAYNGVQSKLQSDYGKGFWKDSNNYYTQNWAWFGEALTEGKFVYEK